MGNCLGISVDVSLPEEISKDIEMEEIKEEYEDSFTLTPEEYEQIQKDTNELLEEEFQEDVEIFVNDLLEFNKK